MPRYVVLEHDHPLLHWDFMLETGDVLRTWRLASPPLPGRTVRATYLSNHRRLYLDYEGPLSGNRGRVVRWDAGTFTWQADESDCVAVRLDGRRLHGNAMLRRGDADEWVLILVRDSGDEELPA
jgi:hypothetical protein